MNAIDQYQDYLSWLRAKYRDIATERALFWQAARPYQIDWNLARQYGQMIHFISGEINATRNALDLERLKLRRELKFRTARAYLSRLSAWFASKSSAIQR